MYNLICFFIIYASFINSRFTILSNKSYPYVICDLNNGSLSYKGLELQFIRGIFQLMNFTETVDYEFICSNSSLFQNSQDFLGTFGGISIHSLDNTAIISDPIIPKGYAIILYKNIEKYFYSKIANINFYAIWFMIPLCFGAFLYLFSQNNLNIFNYLWVFCGEMFFIKPIMNINRSYLSAFQGFLRFFLLGLFLSSAVLYSIQSQGFLNYKEHLSYKNIRTFSEYSQYVSDLNANSIIMNGDTTITELENIIISSIEQDSLYCIDYYWALHLVEKFPDNIEIVFQDANSYSSIISFNYNTLNTFIMEFNQNLKILKKMNYLDVLIKNFFLNSNIENKIPPIKQLNSFSLLWILFSGSIVLIVLLKSFAKFIKNYIIFFKNYFKTMDIIGYRKEVNNHFIQETTVFFANYSNESFNLLKHVRESFLKRQFYSKNIIGESSSKLNFMILNSEINKSPSKIIALQEAHKAVQILEEGKYYESDRFLKKKKRRLSISKRALAPPAQALLTLIPTKNSPTLDKNMKSAKNRTLYEVILENIQNNILADKCEKKVNNLNFRDSIIEEHKIHDNMTIELINLPSRKIPSIGRKTDNEKIDNILHVQPSKRNNKIEKSFKEDDIIEFKREPLKMEEKHSSQDTIHNLPYVSSVSPSHKVLINSNVSILEGYKFKIMNKEKNNFQQSKIVEMDEEEKGYVSSVSPLSNVAHFYRENS